MSRKPKQKKTYIPTSRYLVDKEPKEKLVEHNPPRRLDVYVLPRMRLMSLAKPTEKMDWSASDLARAIDASLSQNALIFCDTSFFSKAIDFAVWDRLLARGLRITPMNLAELQPWLANPFANKQVRDLAADALAGKNDKVEVVGITNENRDLGFDHYFSLLCYRKEWGVELFDQMRSRLGREPSEKEFNQECSAKGKERGFKLAYKGWKDRNKPNRFADEELVVLATQTAIRRTTDMVIFTRDTDLPEQFFKLAGFFQHDYNAMQVAERIHKNSAQFGFDSLGPDWIKDIQEGRTTAARCELPLSVVESFRPSPYVPIHTHVVVVGTSENRGRYKVTLTSFCAEGGLKRLLGIKGRTGLNTDLFGELNCRLGTNTVTMNILAGILKERMVPLGNVQVSEIDKMFATRVNEIIAGMISK